MKTSLLKIGLLVAALCFVALSCNRAVEPPVTPNPPPAIDPTPPPVTIQPEDYTTASGKQPQFVVMAFDGSYSLDMWQQTLDFARAMSYQNHPVHFTYFLSGVYFLNYRKAVKYQTPAGRPPGTSAIGFGSSNNDVESRIAYVNRAIAEGHEIGSHANGHFDGSTWTLADWQQELAQFSQLVFHAAEQNDVSPQDAGRFALNMSTSDLVGFRAPNLGRNDNMLQALAQAGYKYDTSLTGRATDWPQKLDNGLWEFPLVSIQYANTSSYLLSMDYNFYYKQSGARDVTHKGEPQWNQFYQDTYTSYENYFAKNYNGNRAPVFIGSHFSTWNDGVYWEAMRDFAADVCTKPEVYCVDFRRLMDYLETHPDAGK